MNHARPHRIHRLKRAFPLEILLLAAVVVVAWAYVVEIGLAT